jgi:hypothetical protein
LRLARDFDLCGGATTIIHGGREEKEHGGVQCGGWTHARTVVTRGQPAPVAIRSMVGGCLTGVRGSRTSGSAVVKNCGARSLGEGFVSPTGGDR